MIRKREIYITLALVILFGAMGFRTFRKGPDLTRRLFDKELIGTTVGQAVKLYEFPAQLDILHEGQTFKSAVHYTLNLHSQIEAEKLFNSYKPDYGALVALDATTGRILSMVSYTHDKNLSGNLALRASFPSASIFKVITAAAAIDQRKLSGDTIISFNGRSHTLYKHNVEDSHITRWTRHMSIREAFAHSVNTVFAKLGMFYIGPQTLKEYAERFKFNNTVPADMPIERGLAFIPSDDNWALAEAASGFTLNSKMSPLQGALIAAAVVNEGVMMEPYIVDRVNSDSGETLYESAPKVLSVTMSEASSDELRLMMQETIHGGTSRKSFRQILGLRKFPDLEVGGKTGSLTGLEPKGKCDWFVGYARMHGHRIAVAALTINEKQWKVKSSYLAGRYFENYFRQMPDTHVAVVPAVSHPHHL